MRAAPKDCHCYDVFSGKGQLARAFRFLLRIPEIYFQRQFQQVSKKQIQRSDKFTQSKWKLGTLITTCLIQANGASARRQLSSARAPVALAKIMPWASY